MIKEFLKNAQQKYKTVLQIWELKFQHNSGRYKNVTRMSSKNFKYDTNGAPNDVQIRTTNAFVFAKKSNNGCVARRLEPNAQNVGANSLQNRAHYSDCYIARCITCYIAHSLYRALGILIDNIRAIYCSKKICRVSLNKPILVNMITI